MRMGCNTYAGTGETGLRPRFGAATTPAHNVFGPIGTKNTHNCKFSCHDKVSWGGPGLGAIRI